jgi:hypothetical protein
MLTGKWRTEIGKKKEGSQGLLKTSYIICNAK